MTFDDPQIHTVKDFLTDERSALIEHLEVLGKDKTENTSEIVRLLHVVDYLTDRIAGKYEAI
jgi:hypothetical protein|tara:strand:- start:71 stop:256 length:186 start_codon:yes stop_codon:yes gene_type:complete